MKFAPELASVYAKYPLSCSAWMSPDAKGPSGAACFVSAPRGSPLKTDYVHGPGPKGFGYYHLLTRDSYVILYARLTNDMPGCCCDCRPTVRQEVSDWDDVKTTVYNRSVATKPDDVQAKKDAISIARGVRTFLVFICDTVGFGRCGSNQITATMHKKLCVEQRKNASEFSTGAAHSTHIFCSFSPP